MILTDGAIMKEIVSGNILIQPFRPECLGSNSYDVHLGKTLAMYVGDENYCSVHRVDHDEQQASQSDQCLNCGRTRPEHRDQLTDPYLDVKKEPAVRYLTIPQEGYLIEPGKFYLGVTEEYTETKKHVPWLDGKSSVGRLGIFVHVTAGRGDIGFCNHWTLEIAALVPVRIYAGMPIGQLTYFQATGNVVEDYSQKASAKYRERNDKPVPSYMWRNFKK